MIQEALNRKNWEERLREEFADARGFLEIGRVHHLVAFISSLLDAVRREERESVRTRVEDLIDGSSDPSARDILVHLLVNYLPFPESKQEETQA